MFCQFLINFADLKLSLPQQFVRIPSLFPFYPFISTYFPSHIPATPSNILFDTICQISMAAQTDWEVAIRENDVAKLASWCEHFTSEIKSTTRSLAAGLLQGSELPTDNLNVMHVAALYNALDCFVYLHTVWAKTFDKGSPLSVRNAVQALPLHYACYAGATEVATYILTQDPKQATDLPDTVTKHLLSLTAMSKDAAIMQLLLEKGADIGQRQNAENRPLDIAISNTAAECALLLLDHHRRRDDTRTDTPLMVAIHRHQLQLAFEFCRRPGADLQFKDSNGRYALKLAVAKLGTPANRPWFELVKEIADRNGRVDLDESENAAGILHDALRVRVPVDVVDFLLGRQEVNVNRVDKIGDSCACVLESSTEVPITGSPNESYHTQILDLLFNRGFAPANTPRVLLRFLLAATPPVLAIRWLLKYCADRGEPLGPKDVPIPAQVHQADRAGVKMSLGEAFARATGRVRGRPGEELKKIAAEFNAGRA
jgi:hypothetical protein